MKRGMVVEIKAHYGIVLDEKGLYWRVVLKEGLEIGQKIYFDEEDLYTEQIQTRKVIPLWQKTMPIAGIAALFILAFYMILAPQNNLAYAYMTFDINPSIALEINDNGKIIQVLELNPESKALNVKAIKGMPLAKGIKYLKESLEDAGYLKTQNQLLVGIAVDSRDNTGKAKGIEEKAKSIISDVFKDQSVVYLVGTDEHIEKLEKEHMSIGKYEAMKKLKKDKKWVVESSTQEIIKALESEEEKQEVTEEVFKNHSDKDDEEEDLENERDEREDEEEDLEDERDEREDEEDLEDERDEREDEEDDLEEERDEREDEEDDLEDERDEREDEEDDLEEEREDRREKLEEAREDRQKELEKEREDRKEKLEKEREDRQEELEDKREDEKEHREKEED